MRARRATLLAACFALITALIVACTDLFHSTTDWQNACALDAGTPGCTDAALDAPKDRDAFDGNYDFCAWDGPTARAHASAACALLGACETPLGKNRFAECMVQAILAYDCAANPNRQVKGTTRDFWECMASAATCGDVRVCVQPAHEYCPETGAPLLCQGGANATDRYQCFNEHVEPHIERCAAWGQTCAMAGVPFCAGDTMAGACVGAGCAGTVIIDCDDAGNNRGVDCVSYGAGQCRAGACVPIDAGSCDADAAVQCAGDIATGCPSGGSESIDCKALTAASGTCTPTTGGPAWNVSRACFAGTCAAPADSCNGTFLQSCYGGVMYTVDCVGPTYSGCTTVATPDGDFMRAMCVPAPGH